ncbi:hypothetical protein Sjap_019324 [Stephania japonica]|uniref:Uncharacterized protein n=1 Tax=Stephania japonica TaxID=461633 RepID=A0AAP0EYI9_9MAGN
MGMLSYGRIKYCCKAIGMKVKIANACWDDVCRIAYETQITSDIDRIVRAASTLQPVGPISSTKFADYLSSWSSRAFLLWKLSIEASK